MSLLKMALGAFLATIAMFAASFLLYATPLSKFAFAGASDAQSAAVQTALQTNLHKTGTYVIPDPDSRLGSIAYAKGPVAVVHYNSGGFPVADTGVLVGGFIHQFIICFLLGWALMGIDRRVPDYVSRLKTVLLFSLAGSGFAHLGDPLWYHTDWTHAVYLFMGDTLLLTLAGGILARWFLPVSAEMPSASIK